MNESSSLPELEPELEARIIACVLGEVSSFERSELDRIAALRPEVALFRRHMENLHGLMAETYGVRPSSGALDTTAKWKLPYERRRLLFRQLGIQSAAPANVEVVPKAKPNTSLTRILVWGGFAVIVFVLAGTAMPVFSSVQTRGAQTKRLSEQRQAALAAKLAADDERESAEFAAAPAVSAPSVSAITSESAARSSFALAVPAAPPAAAAEPTPLARNEADEKPARPVGSFDGFINYGSPINGVAADPSLAQNNFKQDLASGIAGEQKELSDQLRETRRDTDTEGLKAQLQMAASGPAAVGGATAQPPTLTTPSEANFGNLTKTGTGTVTLSGGNAYTGSTTVSAGTLALGETVAKPGEKEGERESDRDEGKADSDRAAGGRGAPVLGDIPLQGRLFADAKDTNELEKSLEEQVRNDSASGQITNKRTSYPTAGKIQVAQKANKPATSAPAKPAPVAEIATAAQAYSTFSLHVSDVSFQLAVRSLLGLNQRPQAETVRTEEFINAFRYQDPAPAEGSKVGCVIEQAAHPFLPKRNLVRIALATESCGRAAGQALQLTVLLDTSGSMEREDRHAALEGAVKALAAQLNSDDRVTLVGFSRRTRLLADRLPGDQAKSRLLEIVRRIVPEGGTNLEEALRTASDLATRQYVNGAQNRVVLITDGAANLGNARAGELSRMIESLRGRHIAFDACGIGADELNDQMLETLARHGDGRYFLLENSEESVRTFSSQLAGAFRPAAKNVKVQVRFNPARVSRYKLFGFDNYLLKKEDFHNDSVDAAELAREEAGVALYQVELTDGEGDIGEVSVRFLDVASGAMVERSWTIPSGGEVPAFDRAPASIQLAATAALLAENFRNTPVGTMTPWDDWKLTLVKLRSAYSNEPRVQQLVQMVEAIR